MVKPTLAQRLLFTDDDDVTLYYYLPVYEVSSEVCSESDPGQLVILCPTVHHKSSTGSYTRSTIQV